MTTSDEFRTLLEEPEGINVEFKSASRGFHFEELVKYCVALANEGNALVSGPPKTQFNAMKTQFHSGPIAKCLLHKALLDWAKTHFDPIKTQFQPNSAAKRLSEMTFRDLGLGADMSGTAS